MTRYQLVIASSLLSWTATAQATDWTHWRGPEQNGLVREKAVVKSWSPDGENVLWTNDVGGRSTPLIVGDRLFVIAPDGTGECAGERVVALDAASGKVIWEYRFNVYLTDIVEARVGWTALAIDPETGNVYAHGTGGEFLCLDKDGKLVWSRQLTEEFARVSGYGGRLINPIVDEDRVIISFLNANWGSHGPPSHRFLALDKRTGDVLWWSSPGERPIDTTYACPVITVVDGVRLLISPAGDGGVYGLKARTGEKVFSFKLSTRGLNSSPVADGKYAYICQSEENITTTEMGTVLCLDISKKGDITDTGVVWRRDGLTVGYASPALANGRLYVVDNAATMYCLDAKTGKTHWEHSLGVEMRGSPTITMDGVIYVGEVRGRFHILKDAGDKCEVLDTEEFARPDEYIVEINGAPIVADGRVFFQTRYGMYALGDKGAKIETAPVPAMPDKAKPDPSKPAFMTVVPGELTLSPGETAWFTTRMFDANGIELVGSRASWKVDGEVQYAGGRTEFNIDGGMQTPPVKPAWKVLGVAGSIAEDGSFTAASPPSYSAGLIEATAGDLKATARVRVVPKLPIKEDFNAMKVDGVPTGWVGVGGKSKLVDLDGNIVLMKTNDKPAAPIVRMRAYATMPIEGGYTVVADALGKPRTGRRVMKPDMGLINSRYFFLMLGQDKKLRLVTWDAVPRIQVDVPMDWNLDTWYRMKMSVEIKDGKGYIRGKVWPRDEEEPQAWSIEMVDPCPNTTGSAGLYAYANGTKVRTKGSYCYFDNFQVMPND